MNKSLSDTFGIRHDEKIVVTMKVTGEKFGGRVANDRKEIEDTPLDLVTLQLEPEYGRGRYHRILSSEISTVTREHY